jgi:phosphohistidine phosphatase
MARTPRAFHEAPRVDTRQSARHARSVAVLVIRHAEAIGEGPTLSDGDRYLTPAGREQARALGRDIAMRGVVLSWVWSSSLVRAVQTAELVAVAVGFAGAVEVQPLLAPGASLRRLVDELSARGGTGALVGHEPGMSGLTGLLAAGAGGRGFRKAECCHIEGGAVVARFGGA